MQIIEIYFNNSNNIFADNRNKVNKRTGLAFVIVSNQQRMGHNANAKRIRLNEKILPYLLQKAINDIKKMLSNNPTSEDMVKLYYIKDYYTKCLSKSKQNQQIIQYKNNKLK